MPDNFVPLPVAVLTGSDPTSFRPKIIRQAATDTSFQPLSLKSALPAHQGNPAAHQPTVHIKREGDRIVGLQIQCTCGQCIELAFTF